MVVDGPGRREAAVRHGLSASRSRLPLLTRVLECGIRNQAFATMLPNPRQPRVRTVPITLLVVLAIQAPAHATCGTQGGPGYRGPDGKCQGWAELGRVCGCPPSTRCTAEQAHP